MNKYIVNNVVLCFFMAAITCLTLGSCKKNLTPEERKKNLETKINENDCKEITNSALQSVLKNLREVSYESVLTGVQEDIHNFNKENNLYVQIVVSGSAKGIFNGIDSLYYFYLYGRIPEDLADKKEFDENGYNFSLKSINGLFVYSNKENIESLNKAKIESQKQSEEMKKKDFFIGKTKVRYDGKEGNSLVFTSSRELTPDEIADAVQNKIESEGVNMIQFYSGSEKYADYVYKTQCIIFVKYTDKIYKIIGGSAVKV